MPGLPEKYKRLIALGIDKTANLPDLNDMTDRGANPLKPWTAVKTIGTIDMIRQYDIKDEETFVRKFQELSKIPLETLTDQVYNHQLSYFGYYKYNKETIFKYTYCCVVINSLKGNATENRFEGWARLNNIMIKKPPSLLDQKFHTDRLQVSDKDIVTAFISIKPQSFSYNYLQYTDVFAGLQMISEIKGIPWKIFYQADDTFRIIQYYDLNDATQKDIRNWAALYSLEEREMVIGILKNI